MKPSSDNQNKASYLGVLSTPVSIKPPEQIDTTQIPSEGMLGEFIRKYRLAELKSAQFSAFNGKSFEEAAKDAAYQV